MSVGVILDLDGTVYRGEQLVPGAREAIETLRRQGCPFVFVTNAIESREEHVEKLARLGIKVTPDQIINPPSVLIKYLVREMPEARVFAISDPPLLEELGRHFRLVEEPIHIDVVVASCDRTFDYRKLNIAFQALRRGARFFATNADATWPTAEGEIPDAGAIVGALEGCSKRRVELVAGKPSELVARIALEQLSRQAQECLVVGDRLETDIELGRRAGMHTALVLTGVTREQDLSESSLQPDFVLESIAQLPQLFERSLIVNTKGGNCVTRK
jgi:HAD superfamily hydrolase (TIGR01450 family)